MLNVSDVINRVYYWIFTLTMIPGLLSFKYYIISLFFMYKLVLISYVYFFIDYKYSIEEYDQIVTDLLQP